MKKNNYFSNVKADCMLIVHLRFSSLLKALFLLFLLFTIPESGIKAADHTIGDEEVLPLVFDEIPVRVIVEGYKNFYVDAIYTKNKLLYVNVEDLFKMLEIPCVSGQKGNSLSGFIADESRAFLIDYDTKQIKVGTRIINSKNKLVKEMGALYMESSMLNEAFGLSLNFNFRSLAIQLKSEFELPAVRQARIEKMRSNLSKLKGNEIADTIVKRNYHLFKFGTLDWLVNSSQTWNGSTNNRLGFGVGTELLYGEANVSINYYDRQKFDNRQLQYLWRWVDNDKKIIKQAQVGKISSQAISFINAPVIGAVVRNSPTTVRKATGYYTINDITEPNWTIELYINNVLVDFTKADASGSYIFKVPIVYGYTTLKLRFYGPLGEERTEERTMNVPYTVMPANEFEYGLTAGVVQDSTRSHFGKGEFNYGVNRMLTVGGGLEYLSSIPNGPFIPYAKATIQPFSKLTLNAEYAYGVKSRGLLNYYFSKDVLLEIDYTKYTKGQLATRFNAPEERKIKLSVPFRYKKISGFAKLDYTQLVYKEFIYNQANIMLSTYYKQFSANSSAQLNWIDQRMPYVTLDLALSYRLDKGFVVRPSARYNVSEGKFMTCKAEIEKRIPRGYLSASYERNISFNDHYINVSFKYDLPFARTSISTSHSNGKFTTSESAQGSLAFGGDKYTHVSNNSSVSKGGILLYPFLDLNQNGIFDKGEPTVNVNAVKISGGRVIISEKDSIVRIPDLNAFTNYILEFKDSDLETIAWRFKNKIYQVLIDPNQFKRVDIPVIVVGEISGMAYKAVDNSMKGIGRIWIKFYKKNSSIVVAETLSESDGYIYYLGLEPGDYVARVDSAQLSNLGYRADPPQMEFIIKRVKEGDMVGGIDFVLRSEPADSVDLHNAVPELIVKAAPVDENKQQSANPVIPIEQKKPALDEIQENTPPEPMLHLTEQVSIVKDSIVYIPADTLYKVQLLALRHPLKNKDYFKQLLADVPGLVIEEKLGEDSLYHYSTRAFSGIMESREFQRLIRKSGWKDSFVAVYAGEMRSEMKFRLKRGKQSMPSATVVLSKQVLADTKKNEVAETEKEVQMEEKNIPIVKVQEIYEPYSAILHEKTIFVNRDTLKTITIDTLYRVQLLALRSPIKINNYFALLLSRVPGLKIIETHGEDGFYRYNAKTFGSMEEALKYNSFIRNSGWVDSFITTYFVVVKRE